MKTSFAKVTKFTNYDTVQEFARESQSLKKALSDGNNSVDNYNFRERLFKQKESEWADLADLNEKFKPFMELIDTVMFVRQSLIDWKGSPLMTLGSYEDLESTV